ncbi:hypothetical protein [Streptomyces hirsutus]|uniref:hypothetical protein n=1 Tax=Streptomyces hirsutus TaxID=35620 RepID=UPI0007C72CBE|nr:hypothetical protein [Streptomyces hirsutus]
MGRKSVTSMLAALAVATGLLTAATAPAAADTCGGGARNSSVDGASARYWLHCNEGGNLIVWGWVDDTAMDGKCAELFFRFPDNPNYTTTERACGSGERNNFRRVFHDTRRANIYLRLN